MTPPVWLIAEREFRAYTTTATFWVALAFGPILMALALVFAHPRATPPPVPVRIVAETPVVWRITSSALSEAASLENQPIAIISMQESQAAKATLSIRRSPNGRWIAKLDGELPLSPSGRMLLLRTVERDLVGGDPATRPTITLQKGPSPRSKMDPGAPARFSLVMMLWLTLTGSLGMLLQAVVRERSNRALETLLASARAWEIVFGKLIGVGLVSMLVLSAWLGAAAALSALPGGGASVASNLLGGIAQPGLLARAGVIYVLTFGFYGLITIALGAAARDTTSAQNLSRPMFAVLLIAFFFALSSAIGNGTQPAGLIYVPPFAPFILLLARPGQYSFGEQSVAMALMAAATVLAARWAVRSLTLSPVKPLAALFRRRRRRASAA